MLKYYIKSALRNLAKHKISTGINTLGLAIGLTGCLIIYLLVSFELSFDKFEPNRDRIYRLVTIIQDPVGGTNHIPCVPDPAPAVIKQTVSGLDVITIFHTINAKVGIPKGNGKISRFDAEDPSLAPNRITIADPDFFKIFPHHWLAGNPATALSEPNQVVLTEEDAAKYFGQMPADQFMGRIVIYDDSLNFTVSGIVQDWGPNTDYGFKDFLSFASVKGNPTLMHAASWDNWNGWDGSQTFVLLTPGVTPAQIAAQFPKIVKDHINLNGAKAQFLLQPFSKIHYDPDYPQQNQAHMPTLYGLMALALFILIIAVINFINLSTAQSVERAKEIGIRKVLGSKRKSLVFQFLSETFLLTLFAVLVSLMATNPLLRVFHQFFPVGVSLHLLNGQVLLFLFLLIVLTSLLAGFYPAKVISGFLPVISLKGKGSSQMSQKGYLRKGLIIFQFTVSIGFIIATLITGNQIRYMLNADLGFAKNGIINIQTNSDYPNAKTQVLAAKIKQYAGISEVSINQGAPAEVNNFSGTDIAYNTNDVFVQVKGGDENYVSLYQLKLLAGRNFHYTDTINEVLINESCARKLGFMHPEDAIGKLVHLGWSNGPTEVKRPIVGVLADFHSTSLHDSISPLFIVSSPGYTISLKLPSAGMPIGKLSSLMAQIGADWKSIYPEGKFEYQFYDQSLAKWYDKYRQTSEIIDIVMALSILISCMGLFGLITFTVQQKIKEIGVRKVLGAKVGDIVLMLSRDFISLIILSILIASPLAWYFMNKWLREFAYRINISAWIFILAGLSAICIAMLTVSIQAVKAASANPVNSLRTE